MKIILHFSLDLWGYYLVSILSEGVVGLMLFIFLHQKRIFNFSDFGLFKPFDHETKSTFSVGISSFINKFSYAILSFLMQFYLGNDLMFIYCIISQTNDLTSIIQNSLAHGYIPIASFLLARKSGGLLFKIAIYFFWICEIWSLIISILFILFPSKMCYWVSYNDNMIEKTIPKTTCFAVFQSFQIVVYSTLHAMRYGKNSSILFILKFFVFLLCSSVLYLTDKNNKERILDSYFYSDLINIFIGVSFSISPIKKMFQLEEEEE